MSSCDWTQNRRHNRLIRNTLAAFRFYVRVLAAERHLAQPQLVDDFQSDSPISTPKFATKPKDMSKAAQACRVLVVEGKAILLREWA